MARKQFFKPVVSRERYIMDSLVSVFKGGYWVDDMNVEELFKPPSDDLPVVVIRPNDKAVSVNPPLTPDNHPGISTKGRYMSETEIL